MLPPPASLPHCPPDPHPPPLLSTHSTAATTSSALALSHHRPQVERQNGRAAMLGITGCLIHELLGVDALFPTGGMGGAAPPTIF